MGAIGHAIANDMHGHPTDWVLFGLLVFVGCALAVGGYLLDRHSKGSLTSPVSPESHPNDLGEQHGGDGLFTPTQLEAFTVAKEIRDFVTSSLPRPDVSWDNLDPINGMAKRIAERWKLVEPWLLKLRHRYARELAPKVKKAMHLLGEEGFSVSALEPYVNEITNEADAWSAAQVLDHLAYTASYKPWVLDTQWRDTVRRYESMTGDEYRAALDIPEFGHAVEEAVNNRATEAMR